MRRLVLTMGLLATLAGGANAGTINISFDHGLKVDIDGFNFRPLHGGLFDGGFLGFGLFGGLGSEFRQDLFEHRFEDIQSAYDEGLADIDDFYASDEYDDIVNHTERLVDRYANFVTGVERSIDRLDTAIELANEKQTFLSDLLADYQADQDLSAARLARIERLIGFAQDAVTIKIDLLTERQTTLEESLATYQTFQTGLTTYLDEIVTAGGGTTDAATLAAASTSILAAQASASAAAAESCDPPSVGAAAVPEPAGASAVIVALAAMVKARRAAKRG